MISMTTSGIYRAILFSAIMAIATMVYTTAMASAVGVVHKRGLANSNHAQVEDSVHQAAKHEAILNPTGSRFICPAPAALVVLECTVLRNQSAVTVTLGIAYVAALNRIAAMVISGAACAAVRNQRAAGDSKGALSGEYSRYLMHSEKCGCSS